MLTTLTALLLGVPLSLQIGATKTANSMQADVDRLVRAAEILTGTWPSQPPPPVPEVPIVARNGKAVVPLLVALLSDDPDAERDRRRWKVQQQVALALCRIYSESEHCGRTYCDGDPPERIARVREGWLRLIASDTEMRALSAEALLGRFQQEKVFWRQFEIARALATTGDRSVITAIEAWLTHDDRHLRGNAAYVIGRLGDPRGFETIANMLGDRSPRPPGQGIPGGNWSLHAQIRADRYYAAHLLGDLADRRGVDLLVPLLGDEDVGAIVPWSLAEIGDRRSVDALIKELERDDPSARILAIYALARLNAHEALPTLRGLLQDSRRSNLGGRPTVAEAARRAMAVISQQP